MDNVFFTPYIGSSYSEGYQGKKILALGESHYINDDEEGRDHFRDYPQLKEFTSNVVRSYFDYLNGQTSHQRWMTTYTKFARAFHNGEPSLEDVAGLWERIAFYNYIQEPMAGTRVAPAGELFAKYEAAFWEVVHYCRPDLIVVWSYRLWNNLPFPKEPQGNDLFLLRATAGDQSVIALPIAHPASPRFTYQTTFDQLQAARNQQP